MTQSRDPCERILVEYPLFKAAIARILAWFDTHDATAEPDCCSNAGESGSGKTTIISYFASLHPRVDHPVGRRGSRTGRKNTGAAHSQELRLKAAVSAWRPALVRRQHGKPGFDAASERLSVGHQEDRTSYRAFLRAFRISFPSTKCRIWLISTWPFRMHYAS